MKKYRITIALGIIAGISYLLAITAKNMIVLAIAALYTLIAFISYFMYKAHYQKTAKLNNTTSQTYLYAIIEVFLEAIVETHKHHTKKTNQHLAIAVKLNISKKLDIAFEEIIKATRQKAFENPLTFLNFMNLENTRGDIKKFTKQTSLCYSTILHYTVKLATITEPNTEIPIEEFKEKCTKNIQYINIDNLLHHIVI